MLQIHASPGAHSVRHLTPPGANIAPETKVERDKKFLNLHNEPPVVIQCCRRLIHSNFRLKVIFNTFTFNTLNIIDTSLRISEANPVASNEVNGGGTLSPLTNYEENETS